jgi:hypothetical protein
MGPPGMVLAVTVEGLPLSVVKESESEGPGETDENGAVVIGAVGTIDAEVTGKPTVVLV